MKEEINSEKYGHSIPIENPGTLLIKTQQLRLGFWHAVWHTLSLGKLWLELAINGK